MSHTGEPTLGSQWEWADLIGLAIHVNSSDMDGAAVQRVTPWETPESVPLGAFDHTLCMRHMGTASRLVGEILKYARRPPTGLVETRTSYLGPDGTRAPVTLIDPPKRRSPVTLVVQHGATPTGEEHPGIMMIGRVLAATGYRVVVPRLPLLRQLRITKESSDWLVCLHRWLHESSEVRAKETVWVAMSFAGTLLLKTLLRPEVRRAPPKAVFTYGAFSNLLTTYDYLLSGIIETPKGKQYLAPHAWGMIVVFHNYLHRVDAGFDTSEIERVVGIRARDRGDEAVREMLKLKKRDREIVQAIFDSKPVPPMEDMFGLIRDEAKTDIRELSPEFWASSIRERVFIGHGAQDTMVPYTEALGLYRAIPGSDILISNLAKHSTIDGGGGVLGKASELFQLMQFFAGFIGSFEEL